MKKRLLAEVDFCYENIPNILSNLVYKAFMNHRNEVVQVFNDHIDEVNKIWDCTGKQCSFGDYAEDINPEYVKFIYDNIQPSIDSINKRFWLCRYRIDEIGNLIGYVPFIKKSKMWLEITKVIR